MTPHITGFCGALLSGKIIHDFRNHDTDSLLQFNHYENFKQQEDGYFGNNNLKQERNEAFINNEEKQKRKEEKQKNKYVISYEKMISNTKRQFDATDSEEKINPGFEQTMEEEQFNLLIDTDKQVALLNSIKQTGKKEKEKEEKEKEKITQANESNRIGTFVTTDNIHEDVVKGSKVAYRVAKDNIAQNREVQSGQCHYEVDENNYINESVTAWHHTHISITQALQVYSNTQVDNKKGVTVMLTHKQKQVVEKQKELSKVEVFNATIQTYLGVTEQWAKAIVEDMIQESQDYNNLIDTFKKEGQRAKQAQSIIRNDLNLIFELNVLVNRVNKEVDWEQEIINRSIKPNMATPNLDKLKQDCVDVFIKAKIERKKPVKFATWKDYDLQRWAIAPQGAVHSDYEQDNRIIKTLPSRYRNKFTVLNAYPATDLSYWLNREPKITARASTKYEWGKVRAQYGCDLTSYRLTDFAFNAVEDTLPCFMPTGSSATETNVKKLLHTMRSGIPFCFDYDDFNSQHSKESMVTVLRAWLTVFSSDLSDDQIRAAQWVLESINNMEYYIGDSKHRAVGTLFSGWRLTSFINTVLNYVYQKQCDIDQNTQYSIHNGDDVFADCFSVKNILNIYKKCRDINIRAQTSKMSIATISEFLRMDINTKNPTGEQYLSRAVATLVHSRVESGPPTDTLSVYKAHEERTRALQKRGADKKKMIRIRHALYKKGSRIHNYDFISINKHIITHHPMEGGNNLLAPIKGEELVVIKDPDQEYEGEDIKKLVRFGVNDYIENIGKKLAIPVDKLDRQRQLDVTQRAVGINLTTVRIGKTDVDELMQFLGHYKKWTNIKGINLLYKAQNVTRDSCYVLKAAKESLRVFLSMTKKPFKVLRWIC